MVPRLAGHLPELLPFARELADAYHHEVITTWEAWHERISLWWTPERLEAADRVVPGWRLMATHPFGSNLVHVTSVVVALLMLPEYAELTPEQQRLVEWIVIFHDVAKRRQPGFRDHMHTFRSAAITGGALSALGFPASGDDEAVLRWSRLTYDATTTNARGEPIPDNAKLPAITDGIRTLFGWDTSTGLIVRGVLHHQTITNIEDDPQAAELTPEEIRRYISPTLLPIMRVFYLADCDAWVLFDLDNRSQWRQSTLNVFAAVARLMG